MGRYATHFVKVAMSWSEALRTLGFSDTESPSPEEVNKAYRNKLISDRSLHPDLGGDTKSMADLNVAKDVLIGKLRADRGGYQPPSDSWKADEDTSYSGGGYTPPKVNETKVSFTEALSGASIPSGVEWFFTTTPHYNKNNYSGDSSSRSVSGWVAVGKKDDKWLAVRAENIYKETAFIGSDITRYDVWTIRLEHLHLSENPSAADFYGAVMKVWKGFEELETKFNSKVIPAKDWHISSRLPKEPPVTLKQLVSVETGAEYTGKLSVEASYIRAPYNVTDAPGFFKDRYGALYKISLRVNGRPAFDLSVTDTRILSGLKPKSFVSRVFGDYPGEKPKQITRLKDGYRLLGLMGEHLKDLPDWAKELFIQAGGAR